MVGIITVFCQLLEKLIILEKTLHVFKDIYQHIKRLWLTKKKIKKKRYFQNLTLLKNENCRLDKGDLPKCMAMMNMYNVL